MTARRRPHCALPLPIPAEHDRQILLLLVRKMAIHGLKDAQAVMLAMHGFGSGFRRPLAFLRCFMHELAGCSNRKIQFAPCCASRMTRDEALLLDVLGRGDLAALSALTDNDDCGQALAVAQALQPELELLAARVT